MSYGDSNASGDSVGKLLGLAAFMGAGLLALGLYVSWESPETFHDREGRPLVVEPGREIQVQPSLTPDPPPTVPPSPITPAPSTQPIRP